MRELKLNPKGVTIVDDDVFEQLSKYKWYISANGYAIFGAKKDNIKSYSKLHRVIMGVDDPLIKVNHINGDTLNNQRSNLRVATCAQNVHNSKKRTNTKNNYKGVSYIKKLNLWQSRCRMNGNDFYLGLFKSEIAAAYAYNKKAISLSSYSKINYLDFPIDYLENLLISDLVHGFTKIQSKYKYVYFKPKSGRMKSDKYYVYFNSNGHKYRKGYFFTEEEALEYLKNNFSNTLNDIGKEKQLHPRFK